VRRWLIGGVALALALGASWHFGRAPAHGLQVERSLGTVIANTTVQLAARVQGTLENVHFREGQFVRKGDLLFQIDPRPFQTALAQAKAVYERDQAQLKNAIRDKERYFALRDQGAISTQQRDASETNVEVVAATLDADKAALETAQLNLEFTAIRAPIDGKTGPILVQPGNMVAANGTTVLVTITQVKPIKVSFALPQTDLPRIQARQATHGLIASIDAPDGSEKPLSAPVEFTSNAVSAQSGTIELRASFANENLALVPGALVNVTVQLSDIPNALVVPRDAVNDGPNGSFVYIVKNNKAVQRPVSVLFDDTKDAAVSGDLAPGDEVIVEGQLRVIPDAPVKVFGA
jgi:multidrug efflux system membrane fusion protein